MSILNKKETKAYILEAAKEVRPGWNVTQISAAALRHIEQHTKKYIRACLKQHPSRGKTFNQFLD